MHVTLASIQRKSSSSEKGVFIFLYSPVIFGTILFRFTGQSAVLCTNIHILESHHFLLQTSNHPVNLALVVLGTGQRGACRGAIAWAGCNDSVK